MSGQGGAAAERRPSPASRLRTATPLLTSTAAFLAAGLYLALADVTVGAVRLPLGLLFVAMGAITLVAAGVTFVARPPLPRPLAARPSSGSALRHSSRPGRPAGSPRPEAPEPPRPRPFIEDAPPAAGPGAAPEGHREPGSLAEGSDRRAGSSAPLVAPVPVEPLLAPVDLAASPEASVGSEGTVECATCGRPLPAREAWRRCRSCGRALCVSCLTESVRTYGSGYCRSCSGATG